jgi:hypothetical protein
MAIKNLPKTNYNVSEALRNAGYTRQSAYAGNVHKALRNITNKIDFFSPEKIKKDAEYTYKLAKKQKDLTNMARNIEFRGKIAGMIVDKQEIKGGNEDKTIIIYGNKPPNKPDIT